MVVGRVCGGSRGGHRARWWWWVMPRQGSDAVGMEWWHLHPLIPRRERGWLGELGETVRGGREYHFRLFKVWVELDKDWQTCVHQGVQYILTDI